MATITWTDPAGNVRTLADTGNYNIRTYTPNPAQYHSQCAIVLPRPADRDSLADWCVMQLADMVRWSRIHIETLEGQMTLVLAARNSVFSGVTTFEGDSVAQDAIVPWNTSTENDYTNTAGVIQVPRAGVYAVACTLQAADGSNIRFKVQRGAVTWAPTDEHAAPLLSFDLVIGISNPATDLIRVRNNTGSTKNVIGTICVRQLY